MSPPTVTLRHALLFSCHVISFPTRSVASKRRNGGVSKFDLLLSTLNAPSVFYVMQHSSFSSAHDERANFKTSFWLQF